MSWRPQILRTDGVGPSTEEAEFLASEYFVTKRVGMTVDAAGITADANGDKIIRKGTVMGRVTASGKYVPYGGTGAAVNEVDTITVTGATGGSFRLNFDGLWTADIAYNATAAAVAAAVAALGNAGTGPVGSGGALGTAAVVLTWSQTGFAGRDLSDLQWDPSNLVGAATATLVVTTQGKGGGVGAGADTAKGFIRETINAKWGDLTTGLIIGGSVIEERVIGLDAGARTALAPNFTFQ